MVKKKSIRYSLVIETVVFLVLTCVGIIWVAAGPVLSPIMKEYNINRGTVSWVSSIVPLTVVLFSIPASMICSRIGVRKTFAIGAFLMSVGFLTVFLNNFLSLLLTRLVFAAGVSMTFPVAGGIVLQWFSSKALPLVNGFNVSSQSIGNAIALFATVPIASLSSWRTPLTVFGIVALIGALLWLFLGKERQVVPLTPAAKTETEVVGVSGVLKLKATWLLALSMVGPFCLFMAIASWLPTYYNQVFGISLERASSMTAFFMIAGIPACIVGGLLPGWLGRCKPLLIIPGAIIGLAGIGTFIINNSFLNFSSIILFGICVQIYMPSIFTIAMQLPGITSRTVAIALALSTAIGNLGGFVGPLIVGYIADATGSYIPGFIIACVVSLSLLAGGLLLPETGRKAKQPEKT